MVREEEEKSRWWWFESHKTSKHSQWLHSTLAELDAKTMAMLKLIDGNADSFAQRADTYYKKRPELISFVQDFYRAHRSLAERFDHFRSSDHASRSSWLHLDSVSGTNSELEDADSEIEDPDQENASSQDDTLKLEQERLKLIQEGHALRKQLLDKDEEKREVIRQLSRTVEALKDENLSLKRRLGGRGDSPKKRSVFELKPIDKFLGNLCYLICDGNNIL